MNHANLLSKQPTPAAPEHPATEPAASVSPPTKPSAHPKYLRGEYTKQPEPQVPMEPRKTVSHYGQEYAMAKGWLRVSTVFEALDRRTHGEQVLSYRESDIAARGQLLEKPEVVQVLKSQMDFILTEDSVGIANSIYELRRKWNRILPDHLRGLEYKRTAYDKQPQAQKEKCDAYMAKLKKEMDDIEILLKARNLNLWPEEREYGFHPNLLRPEFMTEEQYLEKLRCFDTLEV